MSRVQFSCLHCPDGTFLVELPTPPPVSWVRVWMPCSSCGETWGVLLIDGALAGLVRSTGVDAREVWYKLQLTAGPAMARRFTSCPTARVHFMATWQHRIRWGHIDPFGRRACAILESRWLEWLDFPPLRLPSRLLAALFAWRGQPAVHRGRTFTSSDPELRRRYRRAVWLGRV